MRKRWFVALVHGPSMAPTLRHGDAILITRAGTPRAGDVVVARFAALPGTLVVKRIVRRTPDGWWIEGDNALLADDSRTYGAAEVLGRVVLRWWPRPVLITRRPK
jgi:phage repressor protein C with HTH and peptisase S24 domain